MKIQSREETKILIAKAMNNEVITDEELISTFVKICPIKERDFAEHVLMQTVNEIINPTVVIDTNPELHKIRIMEILSVFARFVHDYDKY